MNPGINAIILLLTLSFGANNTMAQTGLQRLDDRTLEYLANHRTAGQTKAWLFISNTNTCVNIAIPASLLVTGIINKDYNMRQNASSTAAIALFNTLIKKIVRRPVHL